MSNEKSGRGYLFICCTPLQGVIARKIIETERLEKKMCHVFFYTSFDNDVYRNYYNQVRELCCSGSYYFWKPNFPTYIKDASLYFSSISYHSCWFASIDSIFVQLSLGRAGKEIYTFDDGAANVVPGSHYYNEGKSFNYKRLIFWLFGNRYNRERIKSEAVRHYTIFSGQKNIIDNVKFLNLSSKKEVNESRGSCLVILGTVLRELCNSDREIEKISKSLQVFIDDLDLNIFYIPHPREGDVKVQGAKIVKTDSVAEEIVCELLSKYNRVFLAGFGSTSQLTLAGIKEIENWFFCWENEPLTVKQVRILGGELSINEPKEVVLF